MENIHTPERLPTETQEQYRERRKVSRRLAERVKRVPFAVAGPERTARRNLVKSVGIRQAKKQIRKDRNEQYH